MAINYAQVPGAVPPTIPNFRMNLPSPKDTPVDNSGAPPAPDGAAPPPTTPPPDSGGMPSWLTQLFGNGSNGGLFGGGGQNALTMAGLAAALQQWKNAGQYNDTAKTAAGIANPMGDRSQYVDMLKQSWTDPTQFLNDPANQAALKLGLAKVTASDAAKGYTGSGNMMTDLTDEAVTQNNTYLSKIRDQLGQAAGIQFDPQNAAGDLMKGNDQMIQSQNGALSALMMPFMAQMQQNNINNQKNPPGGGGPKSPDEVISLLRPGGAGAAAGPASQWIRDQLAAGRTVDPQDPHIAQAIAEMDNTQPPYTQPVDNPYGPNPDIPSPPPTGGDGGIPWWEGGDGGIPWWEGGDGAPDGSGGIDGFISWLDGIGGG